MVHLQPFEVVVNAVVNWPLCQNVRWKGQAVVYQVDVLDSGKNPVSEVV